MNDDIYSKLQNQPNKYLRRQFMNDIKLLRQRQKELACENENKSDNYFKKKPSKRSINIIKLPNSKNNKKRIIHKNENVSNKYLEKQRIQNKNRILNIQHKNNYKKNQPPNLNINPNINNDIRIKIKTPNKIRSYSPRNKKLNINVNELFTKVQKKIIPKNRIKIKTKRKKRLVSPMHFKRYHNFDNQQNKIKPMENKPIKKQTSFNETNIPIKHSNHKNKIKPKRFKSRKIKVNNYCSIDVEDIKTKLNKLPYTTIVNILYKEKLVKKNTRAPKNLLIDLLLTTKINCINVSRNYI